MVIYYSILIYTCLISFVGCMVYSKNKQRQASGQYIRTREIEVSEKSISLFFALISFALLVYFVGMRTSYVDTAAYIRMFKSTPADFSVLKSMFKEDYDGIGFNFLMIAFKKYISKDFTDWFLFLAIFQAGAIVKLYQKYSCNFFMSAFLFITSVTFTWMMNGIRQFTAVCLILYFFEYVINKKTIKVLIIILLAATIHTTAILWIPVYFIVHFKPWSKEIWICVFLTLVVVFGIDYFTDLLDSTAEGTSYEGIGTGLMNYNEGEDDGVNIIRVAIHAVPAAIALLFRKQLEGKTTKVIDICLNMCVVGVGVYLLGVVTSGIMVGRIPIYFTLVNFILLPWLLENAFEKNMKFVMKIACYSLYFVYFYYVMVIQGSGVYRSSVLNMYY